MNDEYLPPVVTKLKADLSDFMAGLAQARAAMKAFAAEAHSDMAAASRAAGGNAGFAMVTNMRTVIKKEVEGLGEEVGEQLAEKVVPKFGKAGAEAGMGFMSMFAKM